MNRDCSDEDPVYINDRHIISCSICIDEYGALGHTLVSNLFEIFYIILFLIKCFFHTYHFPNYPDVGDKYFVASKCSHIFHSDCILLWLEKHYECPVCREQLVDPNEVASEVQSIRKLNSSDESKAKLQGNFAISNEDEILDAV